MSSQKTEKSNLLATQRLILKPYEEEDKVACIELLLNEEIKKTFMIPNFESQEQAEDMFYKLKQYSISNDHFEYGIYLDNQLIGFINDCEIENDSIELGYVIHPHFKGKGFATEALKAAVNELFRMGYKSVTAAYFEENIASRRVLDKCGMQPLPKDDYIEYLGKSHHCLYYGISR
jgi:RimJ/RimL family protein N-acetyltransferase